MSNYQTIVPNLLSTSGAGVAITSTSIGTAQTIYTAPAYSLANNTVATRAIVKDIVINATTSITVYIYFVPSGGSAAASNLFLGAVPVNTGASFFHWVGTQILPPGMSIQVYASATGGNIFISGGEAT